MLHFCSFLADLDDSRLNCVPLCVARVAFRELYPEPVQALLAFPPCVSVVMAEKYELGPIKVQGGGYTRPALAAVHVHKRVF